MTRNQTWLAAAFCITLMVGGAIGYVAGNRPGAEAAVEAGSLGAGSAMPLRDFKQVESSSAYYDPGIPGAPSTEQEIAEAFHGAVRARDYFRRRHEVYTAAQKLTAETIRTAMEATQHFAEYEREHTQYELVARWLELDVAAAYQWVSALPKPKQRGNLMTEFYHSLGMKDPVTALSYLAREKSADTDDLRHSVFEAWSVHDPIAAVDAALALPDQQSMESAVAVALERLAKRDPQGALRRIEHLPDDDVRREHVKTILREWAEKDHEAAARYAATLTEGTDREEALASVIAASAAGNPDAAMRLLEQLPAGAMRVETISSLVRNISDEEPAIAARFVLELPAGRQGESLYQVSSGLARRDPAAAIEFAGRLGTIDGRASALRMVMDVWSSDDPKAAAEYCASNPPGTPDVMGTAMKNWARKNAPEALAWARALPDGAQREAALGGAVVAIAATDPQQAAKLATTVLAGTKQANAIREIADAWAAKDPRAAASWAAELGDHSIRSGALSSVVGKWGSRDPAAAAAWASQVPENASLLAEITTAWAGLDPAATAKWLDTMPAGSARDSAVQNFARTVADSDPAGAAAWAATVSQSDARENAIGRVLNLWKRSDPEGADTWRRTTPGLSDLTRERLSHY
jgi:hypothetical protein